MKAGKSNLVVLYNEDSDTYQERLEYLIEEFLMLENDEHPWNWALEEAMRSVVKAKMFYTAWRDEEI